MSRGEYVQGECVDLGKKEAKCTGHWTPAGSATTLQPWASCFPHTPTNTCPYNTQQHHLIPAKGLTFRKLTVSL